jgi:hypothetical protein
MRFYNILKPLSSKYIKEMYNINIIFDTKTWKKEVMVTLPMAPIFVNVPNQAYQGLIVHYL